MRLLDTYDTVRNVITEYHQSRHVTGFESPWQRKDTGPSPMEIGGVWQRKDTGPSPMEGGVWQRKGTRNGKSRERNEGFHWKGKGRGKFPFGPLKGKGKSKGKRWFPPGKGKGKGKSERGKGAHTEKRKASRPRCWNCGQHGHVETVET